MTTHPQETIFGVDVVPQAPADSHYGLRAAYQEDESSEKIDLTIGVYRDNNSKPWILPVVRKAEEIYRNDANRNNEYLPIAGLPSFTSAAQRVILGLDSLAIQEARVCSFQSISGTGALHLGGAFLSKFLPDSAPRIYLSSPTWDNHVQLFTNTGLDIHSYPYLSKKTHRVDFDGMSSRLQGAPRGSIVLLQACAHNPTGIDLSHEQWLAVAQLVRERQLFPFFDCAYQGFASGSLSQDNFAIRYFVEQGIELVIAQSFAKNLGLYGQRVGCFHYVAPPGANAQSVVKRVASQLAILQRSEISTPPIYGAKIASIVLNDETLVEEWNRDLQTMSHRLSEMRSSLRQRLEEMETPGGDWSHITDQIGMFSFTGLSEAQVQELRHKWHIYMLSTGRISMAGLNTSNVTYVANAIDDVIRNIRQNE